MHVMLMVLDLFCWNKEIVSSNKQPIVFLGSDSPFPQRLKWLALFVNFSHTFLYDILLRGLNTLQV